MTGRWFITGTDTDVGKSVVTAALAAARRGRVVAAKPVASGVERGFGEDAERIGRAAGHPPRVFARWRAPLSPHRAASLEGGSLDPAALDAWIRALDAETVLVEGVGGWRVPIGLSPPYEVRDLARAAGGRVLLVAADRLGVLNHARLTVDAVRADGFDLAAVVLNRCAGEDDSTRWNLEDLRMLLSVPVVGFPRVDPDDLDALEAAGRALWRDLT